MSTWHYYTVTALNFYLMLSFLAAKSVLRGNQEYTEYVLDIGFAIALLNVAVFGCYYIGQYINQSKIATRLANRS